MKILAAAISTSHAMIQNHEKGVARIHDDRMAVFCRMLDVEPAYFQMPFPIGEDISLAEIRALFRSPAAATTARRRHPGRPIGALAA